jgi:peptidoglycan/LPS O-acetylase OafA/YrhL
VIHLIFLFVLCGLVLRRLPSHPHLFQNPAWADYSLRHILSSLIYSNGFIYGAHPYPNIVLWSLETEVQFYLLAPFLAAIFRIVGTWKRRTFIGILIILGPSAVNCVFPSNYLVSFSLLGNFQYFLIGFLMADLYLLNKIEAARSYRWDWVFPVTLAAVVLLRHWFLLPALLPWLIFVCCLAAFRGISTARFLGSPWVVTIGGMCYTIYMYHWLMISMLIRATGRLQTHVLWLDLLIQFVVMSAAIIFLCAILFALFERPFMQRDWPARAWKKVRHLVKG